MEVDSLRELFRFFSKTDDVLYVGDEDLLPLACDNSKTVTLICMEPVTYKSINLKTIEANPMTSDLEEKGPFDSMIDNLGVDVMRSFQALERLLPLVKEVGRVLMRIEPHGRSDKELEIILDTMLHDHALKTVDEVVLDKKKYMILEKISG